MKILVINLGATSSKVAVYKDETQVMVKNITHSNEELARMKDQKDQISFRKELILKEVADAGLDIAEFSAVISRGGPLKAVESGTYTIDENVKADAANPKVGGRHPAAMGILIADEIAERYGIKAYLADPVSTDELCKEARVTGWKGVYRASMFHALNQKAMARKAAQILGKPYEDVNLIGVHMGGGTSVAAHCKGKVIDNYNTLNEGCFCMDRAGSLPTTAVIDLCYSGKMEKTQLREFLSKKSGVFDLLGTKDFKSVEERVKQGEQEATEVYRAMVFQHAKCIGAMAAVLKGKVDAIFLTGGIAYSEMMCNDLKEYIAGFGPVLLLPGENEMESLAACALRVLHGEPAKRYGFAS